MIFRATELRQIPTFDIFLKVPFSTLVSSTNLVLKAVKVATALYLGRALPLLY